jgi:hypothetical protein
LAIRHGTGRRRLSRDDNVPRSRAIRVDVAIATFGRICSVKYWRRQTQKAPKGVANHLDIALGSQGELEVQLEIAKRVGFLKEADYERLQQQTEEVGRMLNGLLSSIQDQLEY